MQAEYAQAPLQQQYQYAVPPTQEYEVPYQPQYAPQQQYMPQQGQYY